MAYKDPEKQKAYLAEHYRKNKSKYGESSRAARVRKYNKLSELKAKPCSDCNVEYPPYVMEFDHIGTDKIADIAWMLQNSSWQTLLGEIKKCELVCSNCHKVRTYARLVEAGKACHYELPLGE